MFEFLEKMSVLDMHSQDLCSAFKALDWTSAVTENALFYCLQDSKKVEED